MTKIVLLSDISLPFFFEGYTVSIHVSTTSPKSTCHDIKLPLYDHEFLWANGTRWPVHLCKLVMCFLGSIYYQSINQMILNNFLLQ